MSRIDTTLKERGKRYGSFEAQARIAQRLKDVMRTTEAFDSGKLQWDQWEALDHIATKISRILNGDPNYHDHWHDIEGYAKLVADRLAK